jgi:hypothetical protein
MHAPSIFKFKGVEMETKLIRLEEGTLVEVYALPDEEVLMSGSAAKKVKAATHKILPVLKTVCKHRKLVFGTALSSAHFYSISTFLPAL